MISLEVIDIRNNNHSVHEYYTTEFQKAFNIHHWRGG